ncbi:uncharacterized protein LOC127265319 [Andrographis paniculata]|uniref:uncharacterized protein LOC127265319 n=1 Tax=Andrographis paniculata TaxID=175694 RepID=UPI0021E7C6A4|nr:uncharacterized protein LOC127265319 [Andrographis paniculata]
MEKSGSRSYPRYYCSSSSSEFGLENRANPPYTFNGPNGATAKAGGTTGTGTDPAAAEMKRKKRIAGYNMLGTEGKLKASLRDTLNWIKTKVHIHHNTHRRYDL